jgi:hypothetical protein
MTSYIRQRAWLFAAAAAAALTGSAASAAEAINGQLNAVANATLSGATASQVDNQSWNTTPATLNTNVNATITGPGFNPDHTDSVKTFGTAQATWASANAGEVNFTNYGWNFSVNNPDATSATADLTQDRGGSDWSYTFTATANGRFIMDYDVESLTSDGFGLWGWDISSSGGGVGGPVLVPGAPDASGEFVGALVAGQTYTVTLDGNPNVQFGAGTETLSQAMNGDFNWRITEGGGIPEPASWALMLTGFFGLGGALRARRRAASAAVA